MLGDDSEAVQVRSSPLTFAPGVCPQELVFSGELEGVVDADTPADAPVGDVQCVEGGPSVGRPSLPVSCLPGLRLGRSPLACMWPASAPKTRSDRQSAFSPPSSRRTQTPSPDDDGEDDDMDVDERQMSEQEDSETLVTEDEDDDDDEYPSDVDSYDAGPPRPLRLRPLAGLRRLTPCFNENTSSADFDDQAPGMGGAEDPYSGIFFSTSRREEVIEVLPPRSAADRNGECEILSFGEWMSGCPEKGEQEFLFNLWRDETEHPVVCSCGWKRERSPKDFFTLLVRAPEPAAGSRN